MEIFYGIYYSIDDVFNPPRADLVYPGRNFVITKPTDVLAPNGARPSAGTMLTTTEISLDINKFAQLSIDQMIQNGRRDFAALKKSCSVFQRVCLVESRNQVGDRPGLHVWPEMGKNTPTCPNFQLQWEPCAMLALIVTRAGYFKLYLKHRWQHANVRDWG